MNYGKINKCDIANGEGIRVSLFVSGCRNRCKGCFQPETWDFEYGEKFTDKTVEKILSALDNPSVRGLTVLGGEPMEPENQTELMPLLRAFKEKLPHKTVWLYTGNLYEELLDKNNPKHLDITDELLSLVDILIDGPYVEEKSRLGLRFRGSENQRIIDLNETRKQGRVIIWSGCSDDKKYNSHS